MGVSEIAECTNVESKDLDSINNSITILATQQTFEQWLSSASLPTSCPTDDECCIWRQAVIAETENLNGEIGSLNDLIDNQSWVRNDTNEQACIDAGDCDDEHPIDESVFGPA